MQCLRPCIWLLLITTIRPLPKLSSRLERIQVEEVVPTVRLCTWPPEDNNAEVVKVLIDAGADLERSASKFCDG